MATNKVSVFQPMNLFFVFQASNQRCGKDHQKSNIGNNSREFLIGKVVVFHGGFRARANSRSPAATHGARQQRGFHAADPHGPWRGGVRFDIFGRRSQNLIWFSCGIKIQKIGFFPHSKKCCKNDPRVTSYKQKFFFQKMMV